MIFESNQNSSLTGFFGGFWCWFFLFFFFLDLVANGNEENKCSIYVCIVSCINTAQTLIKGTWGSNTEK